MALRKLALMHRFFGVLDGHTCRECSNFIKGKYHDKVLGKCKVYGLTHSKATDWAGRWMDAAEEQGKTAAGNHRRRAGQLSLVDV